jgi:hypothetical protein
MWTFSGDDGVPFAFLPDESGPMTRKEMPRTSFIASCIDGRIKLSCHTHLRWYVKYH